MEMFGSVYRNHGPRCLCSDCHAAYGVAKRYGANPNSKYQKEMATAMASALHHGDMEQQHGSKVWGEAGRQLSVRQRAKHMMAADAHGHAAHSFRMAGDAWGDNRPKAAKEHEEMAGKHAKNAATLSQQAMETETA